MALTGAVHGELNPTNSNLGTANERKGVLQLVSLHLAPPSHLITVVHHTAKQANTTCCVCALFALVALAHLPSYINWPYSLFLN